MIYDQVMEEYSYHKTKMKSLLSSFTFQKDQLILTIVFVGNYIIVLMNDFFFEMLKYLCIIVLLQLFNEMLKIMNVSLIFNLIFARS